MSDEENLPADVEAAYEEANLALLPRKSLKIYERTFNDFLTWQQSKNINSFSEKVLLAYLKILSEKYKPNTLYAKMSIVRTMLLHKRNVNTKNYYCADAFLKVNMTGYERKTSAVFTSDEVKKFVTDAPDTTFLLVKVAAVVGICGALRTCELIDVTMQHIHDKGNYIRVNIPATKNYDHKFFTIDGPFYTIVKKYLKLRPVQCQTNLFFLNYQKERCTNQPVGKNKAAHFPYHIATFLKLPNPKIYTGHCFRRISTTILADGGASIETRHGGWKSSKVAELYVAKSEGQKRVTGKVFENAILGTSGKNQEGKQQDQTAENEIQKLPFNISVSNCSNWHISLKE